MSRHPDIVTVEVFIGAHLLRRLDAAHLGSSSFTCRASPIKAN